MSDDIKCGLMILTFGLCAVFCIYFVATSGDRLVRDAAERKASVGWMIRRNGAMPWVTGD